MKKAKEEIIQISAADYLGNGDNNYDYSDNYEYEVELSDVISSMLMDDSYADTYTSESLDSSMDDSMSEDPFAQADFNFQDTTDMDDFSHFDQ